MPPFATSDEGQEVVALHLLGYPLATTQADLTEFQIAFLLHALPPAIERMHGGGATSPTHPGAAPAAPARDLWEQMKARQK